MQFDIGQVEQRLDGLFKYFLPIAIATDWIDKHQQAVRSSLGFWQIKIFGS